MREANLFVISVTIGLAFGTVYAYFRYHEDGRRAAVRTFLGWVLAFAIAGVVATPVAEWLFRHVL